MSRKVQFRTRYVSEKSSKASKPIKVSDIRVYQTIPERTVELKLVKMPVKDLQPSDTKPLNEVIVNKYVDEIKSGKNVSPPLVHKLSDGTTEIIDGHHRVEAYKRANVGEIVVVENSIADIFRKVGSRLRAGAVGVAKGIRYGVAPAKEEGYRKAERLGAQVGARARKVAVGTPKAIGWAVGLPTGALRAYREGKAIAHGRGEERALRYERAIRKMEKRLSQLKRMAKSKDPFVRRMALIRLRQEFPDEVAELQRQSASYRIKSTEFAPFERALREARPLGNNPFASEGKSF